jgi:hypothetical protein
MSREKKDETLHQLMRGYLFHPAAYASLKAYVDKMLFDSLFGRETNEERDIDDKKGIGKIQI